MLDDSRLRGTSLCVVGNLNRDVKTRPIAAGTTILDDGETAVDGIWETVGGGGANTALAAAALGARVRFLGRVGADALGDRLERTLTRHGVEVRLVRDPDRPSGTSIALSFENGRRHFLSCLPASRALEFADLDLAALDGMGHLLRADVWFSDAMLAGGNQALFQAARQRGVPVSLDLNWDPQWGVSSAGQIRTRKKAVREVLPWVTLAHGNRRELAEFADAPDLETALGRLLDWGVEAVVVHLGAEGAGYRTRDRWVHVSAVPAQRIVQTTGTGDILSLCLMLLRGGGATPEEQLGFANGIVTEFIEGRRNLIPALGD